jgi:hypothetical protein
MIKQLYSKYFQKSKIFLYPLLGLPKSEKDEFLVETFLKYEDIEIEDCKIICQYNVKDVLCFLKYRKDNILKSPYFIFEKQLDKDVYIFIFDLSNFKTDYHYFLLGNYSKFTQKSKNLIKKYFGNNSQQYEYIDTFLYPTEYFEKYSELLDVNKETLIYIGELCDKYDFEKEWLNNLNT